MTARPQRPELLAPAGDWDCARAAVENGADAIYFGLERFNARMRARNFTAADLPALMEFLHRRGVKGYVTFNTLIFANEMDDAAAHLRAIIAAGVDAAIVQDIGVCRLIRRLSPDFPIHASTQMTVTSAAGVEFARDLGCSLVVLARECSIKEIAGIRAASASALPLEVFVHGALCVAYSGQCLTSEALGGRSANRGECAQACRMPYELISDGRTVPLGDRRYLLSPQDLAGLEVLPELTQAGVASLKIEGRLKSPEYVANICQVYRRALDNLFDSSAKPVSQPPAADRYALEMAFSRGLHTGWFGGIDNQSLVHARFGKKRGVFLGDVARVERELVFLRLEGPLKPGDGVVFDSGHPDQPEQGGRVYSVGNAPRGDAALSFGHGDIDFARVQPGDKVWKTSDPELDRRLRRSFSASTPNFRRPLDFEIHGRAGSPLTLIARDEAGHVAQAASTMPLTAAHIHPLTIETLREQLGRLGGSAFRLGELASHIEGDVILPVSELNRLRRDVVAQIEAALSRPQVWTLNPMSSPSPLRGEDRPQSGPASCCSVWGEESVAPHSNLPPTDTMSSPSPLRGEGWGEESIAPRFPITARAPELIVLVRSQAQLEAALETGAGLIYCEFEDPKKYRAAVATFRQARLPGAIFVAPPRIFKTGEEWILKQVRSSEADGYLVRNYDHLKYFADTRRVGDFSLNVANALSAAHLKERFGLERLTASYDLNGAQLEALLRTAPPAWFEITIHQRMPMFHMEHCVFCAFLSTGTDYTNCGRPCDTHSVLIRDRVGMEHPLKADAGCRNTVYNARAQTGAECVQRLIELGARHFRVEFVNDPPAEVTRAIEKYRALLRGQITGADLWRELKLQNQLGVTRGTMEPAH